MDVGTVMSAVGVHGGQAPEPEIGPAATTVAMTGRGPRHPESQVERCMVTNSTLPLGHVWLQDAFDSYQRASEDIASDDTLDEAGAGARQWSSILSTTSTTTCGP